MKRAGIFAEVLAFGYLTGAFMAADFNIAHWDIVLRAMIAMLSVSIAALAAFIGPPQL